MKIVIRKLRAQAMELLLLADTLEQEADVLEASGRAPRQPRTRMVDHPSGYIGSAPVNQPRRQYQPRVPQNNQVLPQRRARRASPSAEKLTALGKARDTLSKARQQRQADGLPTRKPRAPRNTSQYGARPAIPRGARRQRRGNGVTEPAPTGVTEPAPTGDVQQN